MLEVHQVESLGGVAQVSQKFGARYAGESQSLTFNQAVFEVLIRQLHDDDQFTVDDLDALNREDKGMANHLDPIHGAQFLLGLSSLIANAVEVAIDEFYGFD